MQSGFGIECVENRLDQNNICATLNQTTCGLAIGFAQLVIGDVAQARIVHIGRDGTCAIGRANGTGHIARPRRVFGFHRIASLTRQFCALDIQLIGQAFHIVIGLRDGGGGKRIGFDNIAARLQKYGVNISNNIGLGQRQQIIIAGHIGLVIGKPRAAIGRLIKLMTLNHRAHRAVEH